MNALRIVPVLSLAFAAYATTEVAAQAQSSAPQPPSCVVNCYHVLLPYGLYVREVTDGGSFVTLEDGSVWEIRLPQRPVASSWRAGDFVQLTTIAAPVENFEILLSHGDSDRAEARLAGRRPAARQ